VGSFYDALIEEKERYKNQNILIIVTDEIMESIQKHTGFLDNIPDHNKEEEARKLLDTLHEYSCQFIAYDKGYSDYEHKKEHMPQKIQRHITVAKNFKDTLDNLPHIVEQYKYCRGKGIKLSEYGQLVALVEMYIEDLDTKSFKIAPAKNYYNFPKRPNKTKLVIEPIIELAKKYNIKGYTEATKKLSKKLNDSNTEY